MDNTVLGRGEVWFAQYAPGTETPGGYRYIGNTPSFGLSIETQELDHYSSDRGLKIKDKSVTLQVDYSASITCDNISYANLAAFFLGASGTTTQASATGQQVALTVDQGMLYEIGAVSLSNVSVTGSGGAPAYTAVEDYVVDPETGDIFIVEGGAIADATAIEVNFDQAGMNYDTVVSGKNVLQGAMKFKSFNPEGSKTDFQMPKVTLRPSGEFQLKGDEWQQLTFNVEVLAKTGMSEIYANGRPYTP